MANGAIFSLCHPRSKKNQSIYLPILAFRANDRPILWSLPHNAPLTANFCVLEIPQTPPPIQGGVNDTSQVPPLHYNFL